MTMIFFLCNLAAFAANGLDVTFHGKKFSKRVTVTTCQTFQWLGLK